MQNVLEKPMNRDRADLIKYVAPAQRDNNNDKKPNNLHQMALGVLETTQNPKNS